MHVSEYEVDDQEDPELVEQKSTNPLLPGDPQSHQQQTLDDTSLNKSFSQLKHDWKIANKKTRQQMGKESQTLQHQHHYSSQQSDGGNHNSPMAKVSSSKDLINHKGVVTTSRNQDHMSAYLGQVTRSSMAGVSVQSSPLRSQPKAGIRNHSHYIDLNLSEALQRFENYDAHQKRIKQISTTKKYDNDVSPFPKSYAPRQKDVQKHEQFKNCRAKQNFQVQMAKSIELTRQNEKMFHRLNSIHASSKSHLSQHKFLNKKFYPGAPSAGQRREVAQKVDAENQRLLKAIVAQKPHIEQVKTQV